MAIEIFRLLKKESGPTPFKCHSMMWVCQMVNKNFQSPKRGECK
jgi:hypothetical protein